MFVKKFIFKNFIEKMNREKKHKNKILMRKKHKSKKKQIQYKLNRSKILLKKFNQVFEIKHFY